MAHSFRIAALAAASLLVPAGTAAAEGGYFEGVLGLAIPISGDEGYEDLEEELKLGVRAGSGSGPTAIELGADFTPFGPDGSTDAGPFGEVDIRFDRFRVLAGIRHRLPLGSVRNGTLFVRAGLGGDFVRYSASGNVLGAEFDESEVDPGLAAEIGGGFTFPLGDRAYIGGHVAIPMAFHFDDGDSTLADPDLEYTGIDLDLLLTVGTRM